MHTENICVFLSKGVALQVKATGDGVMTDSQNENFHFLILWSPLNLVPGSVRKILPRLRKAVTGNVWHFSSEHGGEQKPKPEAAAGLHSLQRTPAFLTFTLDLT